MAPRRSGRATAVATIAAPVRCAVYCRKSTTAGLDQAFNSLDNQRDAALAYIASQRHENWTALPDDYSDGGFSGGNTDRPGLKRLLADANAGLFDVIIVYKLDRLSRSLLDFLQLHRQLDSLGVQIVSVTEPIDTRTPMGRAFVSVMVSFGQMEREVAAERTAHKIRATRRKGKWTGGMPPLGYDVEDSRLVLNRAEAEQVRAIFELYAANPSLVEVAQELTRRGWRKKTWVTRDGKTREGRPWDRVSLGRLLKDPLYRGLQKLGDETFAGEHQAIVSKTLFEKVQSLMKQNRTDGGASRRNRHGFLLRGLMRCLACDRAMVADVIRSHSRAYRYYRCTGAEKRGHATCPTRSVRADKVEVFVVDQIRRIGTDTALLDETFRQAVAQLAAQRRGLKAELKRIDRDVAPARDRVQGLVAAIAGATGAARTAIQAELEESQRHVETLEARRAEVEDELAALATTEIDQADLARALEAFDPIWEVLLTPEKERVLRLLIERIEFDGGTGAFTIHWRLPGFRQLADEVAP